MGPGRQEKWGSNVHLRDNGLGGRGVARSTGGAGGMVSECSNLFGDSTGRRRGIKAGSAGPGAAGEGRDGGVSLVED
jgi:hypothetical protein